MNFKLLEATLSQKPIIAKLLQEYLLELSQYEEIEKDTNGNFLYPYLSLYWTETQRIPFLIFVEKQPMGFVLINNHVVDKNFNADKSIAEFYIQKDFRKKGIGKAVAFQLFRQFPKKWEVRQMMENKAAQIFWRKVIAEFTGNDYVEKKLTQDTQTEIVLIFNS